MARFVFCQEMELALSLAGALITDQICSTRSPYLPHLHLTILMEVNKDNGTLIEFINAMAMRRLGSLLRSSELLFYLFNIFINYKRYLFLLL